MSLGNCPHCKTRSVKFTRFLLMPAGLPGYRCRCPHCGSRLVLHWRYRALELIGIVLLGTIALVAPDPPVLTMSDPLTDMLLLVLVYGFLDAVIKSIHYVFGHWHIDDASPPPGS